MPKDKISVLQETKLDLGNSYEKLKMTSKTWLKMAEWTLKTLNLH